MKVGDNIADERRRQGLTQEQLAQLAGVERVTVARVENHARPWRETDIQMFATALGVPTWKLLGYDIPPTCNLAPTVRALLADVAKMPEDQAKLARRLIDALAKED